MREALILTVIEKIRQLGLVAWKKIYDEIETLPLTQIYELTTEMLNTNVLEAHIPRSLNINQVGIQVSLDDAEGDYLKIDPEFAQQVIDAAYTGNVEFLSSCSMKQLENSAGILGNQTVDVFSDLEMTF